MKNKNERQAGIVAKEQVFRSLGGVCCVCGFDDRRALQIDHKAGGGVHQLRRSGNKRWYYRYVLNHLDKYQVLCANCNWIKRVREAESPHYVQEVTPESN